VSIQEHWLFTTFEKQKLIDFCLENNYTYFLKCCDEMEPISPKIRTRGFGGSGILWRKSLDPFVARLSDGCERICAIKTMLQKSYFATISESSSRHFLYKSSLWLQLFVDIYAEIIQIGLSSQSILIAQILSQPSLSLATKGSKDFLHRIPPKYDFCNIVLAGDLNASFIRPKPTVIDKLFMEDIVEMGFVLPDKYPRDSTFHHFNGYSVSQIDYILPFRHCDFITDIKIHHRESQLISVS
jgi:hypothetical protein